MAWHCRHVSAAVLFWALVCASAVWPCVCEGATLLWKVPTGKFYVREPVVADGRVYTHTKYGSVDVLDLKDGSLIQELVPPDTAGVTFDGLLLAGDVLYVTGWDSDVTAFSRHSGDIIWATTTTDRIYRESLGALSRMQHHLTRAQVDAERIYAASGDGHIYALGLSSGERLWAQSLGKAGASAPPLLHSGELYLVSWSGELLALDAATGSVLWRVDLGEPVEYCQPVLQGESLFVCGNGGSVFSISIVEHEINWVSKVGREFRGSVDVEDGLVVAADEAGIYCLDASDGGLLWYAPDHSDSPVLWDGVVYCLTRDGRFLLLDAATGGVLEEHDIHAGHLWSRPVVAEGKVIVAGKVSHIYTVSIFKGTPLGENSEALRLRYIRWLPLSPGRLVSPRPGATSSQYTGREPSHARVATICAI